MCAALNSGVERRLFKTLSDRNGSKTEIPAARKLPQTLMCLKGLFFHPKLPVRTLSP